MVFMLIATAVNTSAMGGGTLVGGQFLQAPWGANFLECICGIVAIFTFSGYSLNPPFFPLSSLAKGFKTHWGWLLRGDEDYLGGQGVNGCSGQGGCGPRGFGELGDLWGVDDGRRRAEGSGRFLKTN